MNRPKFLIIQLVMCFTAAAFAQTAPPAAAPPQSGNPGVPPLPSVAAPAQAPAPPGPLVPESEPVITLDGVCDVTLNGTVAASEHTSAGPAHSGASRTAAHTGAAKTAAAETHAASNSTPGKECKTLITRAEFERLMKAVAPGVPAQARRQIATRYAQLLVAANEGVKLNIEKDPEYSDQLAIARLQVLAQGAERKLQAQATDVSESEMKKYYDENPAAFEEISLTRLFVPRNPADKAESPADLKAIADNARQQLMIGGDPEKIEKSIYEQLKNTSQPPPTKFGKRRRGTLPVAEDQKLFSMKEDQISDPIEESGGSYVVYRLDSRRQLSFDEVKEEIKQRVARQRINDVREQMTASGKPVFNDAYFGPEPAPRSAPAGAFGGARGGAVPPPGTRPAPVPQPNGTQSVPPSNPK